MILSLVKYSIPIIYTRIVQALSIIIGNIFVAQLGLTSLAASALISASSMFILSFATGCLLSLGPLFSQENKSRNTLDLKVLTSTTLIIFLTILIAFAFSAIQPILMFFGQSAQLVMLTSAYFDIYSFSILPLLIISAVQQFLFSTKYKFIVLIHSTFTLFSSIIFSYIFIFGLKFLVVDFEGYGLLGLAVSGVCSAWLSLALLVILLFIKGKSVSYMSFISSYNLLGVGFYKWATYSLKFFLKSIPVGFQLSLEILLFLITTLLIGHFGHAVLGAWQAVSQFVLLFAMIPFSISHALSILISEKYSKNLIMDIKLVIRSGYILVTIWTLAIFLIFIFLNSTLLKIYLWQHDLMGIDLNFLSNLFIIMAFYQLVDGWRLVGIGVLRGYMKTLEIFKISLFLYIGLSFLAIWVFMHFQQISYFSGPLGMLVGLLITTSVICAKRGNRQSLASS